MLCLVNQSFHLTILPMFLNLSFRVNNCYILHHYTDERSVTIDRDNSSNSTCIFSCCNTPNTSTLNNNDQWISNDLPASTDSQNSSILNDFLETNKVHTNAIVTNNSDAPINNFSVTPF